MNFAVTEEQHQLEDSLRRLLSETNDFESRRRRLRAAAPDRLALWPRLAELGVIGAAFDEAHGGFAGDPRTMAVVLAALGESLAIEPFLANAVIVGRILQRSTANFALALTEDTIAGRHVCVLAHDAGANPFATPGIAAKRDPDDAATLSGRLRCVRHADVAVSFLVPVTEHGDVAIYHIPRDAAGLSLSAYRLMDDAGGGDLEFDGVRAASTARLTFATGGDSGSGAADVLREALEWGVLGLAAEAAGIARALNRATFSHLSTRRQFGVPLASFQALQHRAADMFIAAEELTAAVNHAIEALAGAAKAGRSQAVSAAKVMADVAGRRIGHESVQMHGGMGVSDELNVSHYARRLAVMRAELGNANTHRLRFAGMQ